MSGVNLIGDGFDEQQNNQNQIDKIIELQQQQERQAAQQAAVEAAQLVAQQQLAAQQQQQSFHREINLQQTDQNGHEQQMTIELTPQQHEELMRQHPELLQQTQDGQTILLTTDNSNVITREIDLRLDDSGEIGEGQEEFDQIRSELTGIEAKLEAASQQEQEQEQDQPQEQMPVQEKSPPTPQPQTSDEKDTNNNKDIEEKENSKAESPVVTVESTSPTKVASSKDVLATLEKSW